MTKSLIHIPRETTPSLDTIKFLPENLETCEWLPRIDPPFQEGAIVLCGGLPFSVLGFMFNILLELMASLLF